MRTLLVLVALQAMSVPVFGETTMLRAKPGIKKARPEMRFMKNFDRKIAELENYSVTFDDGTVMRRATPRAKPDGLMVKMLPKKRF